MVGALHLTALKRIHAWIKCNCAVLAEGWYMQTLHLLLTYKSDRGNDFSMMERNP